MVSNKNVHIQKMIKESLITKAKTVLHIPKTYLSPPNFVQIESTTKCNMKCKQCIRGPGENFDMSFELYKSIVDQLILTRFGTRHVDLTGVGEPLLNPNLEAMVDYAKRRDFRVSFTSNFMLMNESRAADVVGSGVDYLYASVDGGNKETYEKIRVGANYEKFISNIEHFMEIKSKLDVDKPTLRFYVALQDDNVKEIQDFIELASGLGISLVNFNRLVIPGKEHWTIGIPVLDIWKSLPDNEVIGRRGIPLEVYQPCVALKGCFVTYDGKVLPCNNLTQMISREEYESYCFGDLAEDTLYDVWFSKDYRKFRVDLARGARPSFCEYCSHAYQF
mgnify:CR=1 FL=1